MATYSLKKSYQLKNLKEVEFKDLRGNHGIFTTMWVFGKPAKILFFDKHLKNLIKSLKSYGISKRYIRKDIIKIINKNLLKNKSYNHLLRVALNKKIISISIRKRLSPRLNFSLRFLNLKREKPNFKNLKYKKILSYLKKIDNSKKDIGLISKKKEILETATSNLLFIKNDKIFIPKDNYYEGITLRFFKSKIKRMIKKKISLSNLCEYDEILLVGSGKGVVSVKTIQQIGWKRKKLKMYNMLYKNFQNEIRRCKNYEF